MVKVSFPEFVLSGILQFVDSIPETAPAVLQGYYLRDAAENNERQIYRGGFASR
jgi:hypothetical protein